MESVFITGASGCVGHYVVEQLEDNYQLYLLVRNPDNLLFDPLDKENIEIIHEDLDNISSQADILSKVDYCIHIATAWGGDHTKRINVERTHEMFNLLDENKIKRVIYFSTASILGRDTKVLPEAERYGTDYIRTKSLCYQKLPETDLYEKIVTVFPTLVFGGDDRHPRSHLTRGLPAFKKFAWLIGRIKIDMGFHFIHAEDIAKIVKHLMKKENPDKKYVMGNNAITFGDFTRKAARYFGYNIGWQIKISPSFIFKLLKLIRAEVSEWDRFCVEYKNFVYPVVNCPSLGIPSNYSKVEEVISD